MNTQGWTTSLGVVLEGDDEHDMNLVRASSALHSKQAWKGTLAPLQIQPWLWAPSKQSL